MATEVATDAQDARLVSPSRADRLRVEAEQAAAVRALANHPDVIALRVEKVRAQVDALVWVGIGLGLAFTMVNVQTFAAAGAAVWSLPWLAAWLLDPMVSLTLVAVLRAEQITARYQVAAGAWADRTKWFAFVATYVMNTWQSWTGLHPAGIVLHSVPPVLVFCSAETAPWLRDRLTEAVTRAATPAFASTTTTTGEAPVTGATDTHAVNTTAPAPALPDSGEGTDTEAPAAPPVRQRARRSAGKGKTGKAPVRRKLLADYVADARAAWMPGVQVSPAWVRSVTDCARGTSKNVADALTAELATGEAPTPLPTGDNTATGATPAAAVNARDAQEGVAA